MSRCVHRAVLPLALMLAPVLAPAPAPAQGGDRRQHVVSSEWWPEVEKAEETLRHQRWKAGRRQVERLSGEVVRTSWHGTDLRKLLARLAFLRAVADANLGEERAAVWYWHMACNLDFRLRTTDFTPWGEAGDLLLEHPLRRKGEVPVQFHPPRSNVGLGSIDPPTWPRMGTTPTVLNNTGAALEHRGDMQVELIIDQEGRPHHPVVQSSHLHPVIVYATLRWLLEGKPFEPARVDGEPRDYVLPVTIRYHVERW